LLELVLSWSRKSCKCCLLSTSENMLFHDEVELNRHFSLCKLGTQGHIEDIAIKAEQQGKKFGVKLLQALDYVAEQVGCYKV
jgi:hypothetical protein